MQQCLNGVAPHIYVVLSVARLNTFLEKSRTHSVGGDRRIIPSARGGLRRIDCLTVSYCGFNVSELKIFDLCFTVIVGAVVSLFPAVRLVWFVKFCLVRPKRLTWHQYDCRLLWAVLTVDDKRRD